VIIWEEIPSELTPLEVFTRLKALPFTFFLDSSKEDSPIGRYSFVAFDPFMVFLSRGKEIVIRGAKEKRLFRGDPLYHLAALLERFYYSERPSPFPLQRGMVGYLSYELGRWLEDLPPAKPPRVHLPECCFGLYDTIYAYDHCQKKGYFLLSEDTRQPDRGLKRRRDNLRQLLRVNPTDPQPESSLSCSTHASRGPLQSNFTKEAYLQAIMKAKEYIAAGEIYQVNLAQCFTSSVRTPPWVFYRDLRSTNPVPFGAYFNLGPYQILCNSPERFLRVSDGYIETRPIKGTARRGDPPIEDLYHRDRLARSPKDRAEHLMIVDLERNDLGRICRYGTIRVQEFQSIEAYNYVYHMVSTVVGELRPDVDLISCIKACFPGGSITGAPKIRAMEIIHELEPHSRGVYTGALGYIDFSGQMDLNIAIRTGVYQQGELHFWVGGAIVADSDPVDEYQETLDKAQSFLQVLQHHRGSGPDGMGVFEG